jgi:hypothetical protein
MLGVDVTGLAADEVARGVVAQASGRNTHGMVKVRNEVIRHAPNPWWLPVAILPSLLHRC